MICAFLIYILIGYFAFTLRCTYLLLKGIPNSIHFSSKLDMFITLFVAILFWPIGVVMLCYSYLKGGI